jgi:hypothetical protein
MCRFTYYSMYLVHSNISKISYIYKRREYLLRTDCLEAKKCTLVCTINRVVPHEDHHRSILTQGKTYGTRRHVWTDTALPGRAYQTQHQLTYASLALLLKLTRAHPHSHSAPLSMNTVKCKKRCSTFQRSRHRPGISRTPMAVDEG